MRFVDMLDMGAYFFIIRAMGRHSDILNDVILLLL